MIDPVEAHLRQVLQEDASGVEAPSDLSESVIARGISRRRRVRVLTGGLAIAVASIASVGLLLSAGVLSPQTSAAPSQPAGDRMGALPDAGLADCQPPRSEADVFQRQFAFDGVVTAIETHLPPDQSGVTYAVVTFSVKEWFKGGTGPKTTARLVAPLAAGQYSEEAGPAYDVGTRLLVSGDQMGGFPMAFGCGYTRYFDAVTGDRWRAASTKR